MRLITFLPLGVFRSKELKVHRQSSVIDEIALAPLSLCFLQLEEDRREELKGVKRSDILSI